MFKSFRSILIVLTVMLIGLAITSCSNTSTRNKTIPKLNIGEAAGEVLFQQKCASCHLNGGNQIRKNKPVLQSYKVSDKREFIKLLLHPVPPMPKFEDIANDPEQFLALLQYIRYLEKTANES